MKPKIIISTFIFLLLFTSCSDPTIEISQIVKEYIETFNIKESQIISINYEKIEAYNAVQPQKNLKLVSERIDEYLEIFYTISPSNNEKIHNGDIVCLDVCINDTAGNILCSQSNIRIMIGNGYIGKNLESYILESKVGDSIYSLIKENPEGFFVGECSDTITISILGIYDYIPKSETNSFITRHGFNSFNEFYDYMFQNKVNGVAFETEMNIENEFIKYAVEQCNFQMSSNEIENFALNDVRNHKSNADSFGISLGEYINNFLLTNENDFYLSCVKNAELEIKRFLLVGALAQYNKIDVSEKELEIFCKTHNIDKDDSVQLATAKYLCVEQKLFNTYLEKIPEISNSQIEALIDNDRLFYKYTHWDSASLSVDNSVKDSTGEYYKITDPDFDTFAEWTAFAEAIYYGDLLEEQTEHINSVILNVDADAYVIPGSRGNPVSQEYTYETVSSEKDKVVIEVSFTSLHEEDYGEPIIYRYEMTATENGWRITGFSRNN